LNLPKEDIDKRPNIDNQIIKQIIPISDKKARVFLETDLSKDYLNQFFENEDL